MEDGRSLFIPIIRPFLKPVTPSCVISNQDMEEFMYITENWINVFEICQESPMEINDRIEYE